MTVEDYNSYKGEDDENFEVYSPPTIISSGSDDDDDFNHRPKKKGKFDINDLLYRLDNVEEKVSNIEKQLQSVSSNNCTNSSRSSNKDYKLDEIRQLFQCVICQSLLQKNSNILPCCNQMGYETCIRQWLTNNTTCPLCRATTNIDVCLKIPSSFNGLLDILHPAGEEDIIEI